MRTCEACKINEQKEIIISFVLIGTDKTYSLCINCTKKLAIYLAKTTQEWIVNYKEEPNGH